MTSNGQAGQLAEAIVDQATQCVVEGCKSTRFQEWVRVVVMEHQRMKKTPSGRWTYGENSVLRKDEAEREVLGIRCERGHDQEK